MSGFTGKKTEKGVDLLVSLCDIYHTSEDELKITLEKTNKLIVDILNKKPCPASECKAQNLEYFNTGASFFILSFFLRFYWCILIHLNGHLSCFFYVVI